MPSYLPAQPPPPRQDPRLPYRMKTRPEPAVRSRRRAKAVTRSPSRPASGLVLPRLGLPPCEPYCLLTHQDAGPHWASFFFVVFTLYVHPSLHEEKRLRCCIPLMRTQPLATARHDANKGLFASICLLVLHPEEGEFAHCADISRRPTWQGRTTNADRRGAAILQGSALHHPTGTLQARDPRTSDMELRGRSAYAPTASSTMRLGVDASGELDDDP